MRIVLELESVSVSESFQGITLDQYSLATARCQGGICCTWQILPQIKQVSLSLNTGEKAYFSFYFWASIKGLEQRKIELK